MLPCGIHTANLTNSPLAVRDPRVARQSLDSAAGTTSENFANDLANSSIEFEAEVPPELARDC